MANTLRERYIRWRKHHMDYPEPTAPDMDIMDEGQIRVWLDAVPRERNTRTGEASHRFPGRPPGYTLASRLLAVIAFRKLHGLSYEKTYKRLPCWAQWRDRLPIEACVLPGKKFRKSAPRGQGPLSLLKGD